jgi:DNA-binding transcriptional LysR family regulator
MQWADLRIFLPVAEAGSLRKAAGALRLGQPTIGRHLHQLELSVGDWRPCPWRAAPPSGDSERAL